MSSITDMKKDVFWVSKTQKTYPYHILEIRPLELIRFLKRKGFGRYITNQKRTDGDNVVRYKDGVLYVHNLKSIKNWLVDYWLKVPEGLFHPKQPYCLMKNNNFIEDGYYDKDDLLHRLAKNNFLGEYHFSFLPEFNIDNPMLFLDEKEKVYCRFRNKVVAISGDKIEEIDWKDVDGSVWESEIIQHDININNKYEDGDGGLFEKYLDKTCLNETYVKSNNWKANYQMDEEKRVALKTCYGYMISNFKTPLEGKAVVFIDADSDGQNAKGGTGKSVIMNSIKSWKETIMSDGRKTKSFQDKHLFSDVNYDTRFIHIQDLNKGFDFGLMYNMINDTLEIEPKYRSKIYIPFEFSPKFGITTNYVDVDISNHSTTRRLNIIEFGNYWKKCVTMNEAVDDVNNLGKELFKKDFTQQDWDEFYNFGFKCIQLYLNEGLVQQDMSSLKKKVIKMKVEGKRATGEFDWIVNWLEEDRVRVGADKVPGIKFDDLYSSFHDDFSHLIMLSSKTYETKFKRMLYDTCEGLGYEYNGHKRDKMDNPSDRRHLLYNPTTGKNDEYITVTQITPNPLPEEGLGQSDTHNQIDQKTVRKLTGDTSFDELEDIAMSQEEKRDEKGDEFDAMWDSLDDGVVGGIKNG